MSSKPWTVAIAAAISLGCQSLADVQPAELEGDWVASEARFVEIAAPKRNNIDIIDLGFEVEMDLDAGGNFVLKLFEPDDTFDSVDGSLVIDGTSSRSPPRMARVMARCSSRTIRSRSASLPGSNSTSGTAAGTCRRGFCS